MLMKLKKVKIVTCESIHNLEERINEVSLNLCKEGIEVDSIDIVRVEPPRATNGWFLIQFSYTVHIEDPLYYVE
jgi:hypothetical protein